MGWGGGGGGVIVDLRRDREWSLIGHYSTRMQFFFFINEIDTLRS
jgi:hypothetical protein